MFTTFPYSNFQNLNLDWILKQIKDIPSVVNQQVSEQLQDVFVNAHYDANTETILFDVEGGSEKNE